MKKSIKHISKLLLGAFLVVILLFIGYILHQGREAKQNISEKFPLLLEEVVKKHINQKSESIYYAIQQIHDPNKKIGEYETRTARYTDTTFIYKSRIVDIETFKFNSIQTLYLKTGQLHADSIQKLFDEELQANNIHVESIIGITASFYTQLNNWSSDTTAIDINLRTSYTNQGLYEDINYYAYTHYSFYTLWELMPKTTIYILFICCLLSGFLLFWWIIQRKKERKNGITLLKNGDYRIKDILFDVKEKKLITDEKDLKLAVQPYELILLFILAANHRVSKSEIKQKFWPKTIDATSNMTSGVNRLNKRLKDINCAYTINTDPKNEKYYIFSHS
jgi:hypothetical protein